LVERLHGMQEVREFDSPRLHRPTDRDVFTFVLKTSSHLAGTVMVDRPGRHRHSCSGQVGPR
jgi:hypothetical protein